MALPTYDYEAEQAALARQYKIAEAMQAQGMQSIAETPMVGQVGIQRSPLEGILKVVQSYLGSEGVRRADSQRKELGQRYAGELKSGIARYIEGTNMQPGSVPEIADESGGHGGAPRSAADVAGAKRAAILEAIGSNHPVLQQLGMAGMKQEQEGRLTPKDLAGYATPASVLAAPNNPGAWAGKVDLKEVTPGAVTVDGSGTITPPKVPGQAPGQMPFGVGTPVPPGWKLEGGGQGYDIVRDPSGDLYQRSPSGLKKMDNSTKINNSPNFHPGNIHLYGQKAGFEKWSEAAAKRVSEMSEQATAARNLESRMVQLEALTAAGTHGGPAATPAQFIAGLANQAGIKIDTNKLANSATFESESTRAWAEMMQSMGGARGLVKEESEKIAKSLPALTQTPQGRQQIIALIRQAAQQQQTDAKLANEEYGKALQTQNPAAFTFGLSRTMEPQSPVLPSAPGSTSPRKPTQSNW